MVRTYLIRQNCEPSAQKLSTANCSTSMFFLRLFSALGKPSPGSLPAPEEGRAPMVRKGSPRTILGSCAVLCGHRLEPVLRHKRHYEKYQGPHTCALRACSIAARETCPELSPSELPQQPPITCWTQNSLSDRGG